jgi:hypothetical protein
MKSNRIHFHGNPWPEGHNIKEFRWSAETRGHEVWFHFHLETDDYYAERDIEDDEEIEYPSDWEAPIVWGNFHSCTISSADWHHGGFKVCSVDEYSLERLDGLELRVDPLPCELADHDARAFHTYLLGHDTVVDHVIKFVRVKGTDSFNISWSGKIALTYVGDYDPCYQFSAEIASVEAPTL